MMKMSPREKILVTCLIFLMIAGGFYQYIYTPLSGKLEELKRNNELLAREIINVKKEQARKKNLVAEAESLQAEYERLNLIIPVEPEMLEAAGFIKEAARECEVSITSLEYEPGEEKEGVASINMKIVAEGRYLPLLAFIKRIENSSRFYMIENMSLSARPLESSGASTGEGENEEKPAGKALLLPFDPHYFSLDLKLRTYCERM